MQINSIGDYKTKSFLKEEITTELVNFVRLESDKAFASRRSSYNYKDNYVWDETNPRSLAYKFKRDQFEMINLVFRQDEFLSFSGTYLNQNRIAFGGVRLFSTPSAPIAPYHMAYIIPIQLAHMKTLGAKAFVLSYNAGVREGLYKLVSRIADRKNPKNVYLDAQLMYRNNNFTRRETPVLCNSVYQRLHYCILDKSLVEEELIKLL